MTTLLSLLKISAMSHMIHDCVQVLQMLTVCVSKYATRYAKYNAIEARMSFLMLLRHVDSSGHIPFITTLWNTIWPKGNSLLFCVAWLCSAIDYLYAYKDCLQATIRPAWVTSRLANGSCLGVFAKHSKLMEMKGSPKALRLPGDNLCEVQTCPPLDSPAM